MARRHRAERRKMAPDHKYGDQLVSRIISNIMERGKKTVAENIVYGAIELIQPKDESAAGGPLDTLYRAIENAKPRVEVRARRVGGATYQVPTEVNPDRGFALAVRWIVSGASKRKGVPMMRALANELRDAATGQGSAVKKREDVHKMAQANKAFAHFRW